MLNFCQLENNRKASLNFPSLASKYLVKKAELMTYPEKISSTKPTSIQPLTYNYCFQGSHIQYYLYKIEPRGISVKVIDTKKYCNTFDITLCSSSFSTKYGF